MSAVKVFWRYCFGTRICFVSYNAPANAASWTHRHNRALCCGRPNHLDRFVSSRKDPNTGWPNWHRKSKIGYVWYDDHFQDLSLSGLEKSLLNAILEEELGLICCTLKVFVLAGKLTRLWTYRCRETVTTKKKYQLRISLTNSKHSSLEL